MMGKALTVARDTGLKLDLFLNEGEPLCRCSLV